MLQVGDPPFAPLGFRRASNLNAETLLPPFPLILQGHAGFGGAIFETGWPFFRNE